MLEFFSVSLIIVLGVMSPGPDFILVLRNALGYPSKIAVFTVFGITASVLLHTAYTVIGLTVLISQSPLLFHIVKYLGAGYLIYLGLKGLFQKSVNTQSTKETTLATISMGQAFKQGFLCNLLNPKTILFFLALFTLVIDSGTQWWIKALYGIEIALIHFIWFATIAMIVGHSSVRARLHRFQSVMTRVMGGALVYLGSRLALLSHG